MLQNSSAISANTVQKELESLRVSHRLLVAQRIVYLERACLVLGAIQESLEGHCPVPSPMLSAPANFTVLFLWL